VATVVALAIVILGVAHRAGDEALAPLRVATGTQTTAAPPATLAPSTAAGDGALAPAAGDGAAGPDGDAGQPVGPPITSGDEEPTTQATTTTTRWEPGQLLPTDRDGVVVPQTTPDQLVDRRLQATDTLPPPSDGRFTITIEPLSGEPLERSTWHSGCPVAAQQLHYLTVSFWGFDDRAHQGELIVNESEAERIGGVFETLFEARYPIEEMRIATPADVAAPPTGDGNNTSAFVCREVTGGTRFSEHAYGLAIDVNPFQNPYQRSELVLPELAAAYLDRGDARPGMILEGDVVVEAFDGNGWGWGGRWSSLKDYQHFALNDR
jgi:hypothetical protein